MSNTNDFLAPAIGGGANVDSQATFAASGYLTTGFNTGTAFPNQANKLWRQSGTIANMIGLYLNQNGHDALDNADITTLLASFTSSVQSGSTINTTQSVTGNTHAFIAADANLITLRSNSGVAMLDTLPGTGLGVMVKGWRVMYFNSDTTGVLAITVASGANLDGVSGAFVYVGPGQKLTITSDGTNYWTSGGSGRARLGGSTSVFVSTGGSDTLNSGLTSGTAFATLQKAINFIETLDCNGVAVTVSIANGTYSAGIVIKNVLNAGIIQITGNTGTPSSVVISTSGDAIDISTSLIVALNGLQITSSAGSGVLVHGGAVVSIQNINFGACNTSHMICNASNGFIQLAGNYSVVGAAQSHISISAVAAGSTVTNTAPLTVTITGTPAFSVAFVAVNAPSVIETLGSITWSGSATGKRYSATANGVIDSAGSGATYFPGNVSGTTATGGQYI